VLWQSFQSLGQWLRLHLLSPNFFRVCRSRDQSNIASGNIQTVTRSQTETAYWTLTGDNEASMQIYMMADAHREAMPKLVEWSDEASFVHWNQDSSELPSWDIAEQWMAEQGKFVSLKYSSKIFGINLVFKNGRERADVSECRVTGKAPRRFENFARDYATIFAHKNLTKHHKNLKEIKHWNSVNFGSLEPFI